MKQNGKIAQLPETIRTGINLHLYHNYPRKKLLKWLNDLPEVKTIMARHFDGRPINGKNLSEWKNGGYKEWHAEFVSVPSVLESDPVFHNQYLSLLKSYYAAARDRLQRDIVRSALECLKQARLNNNHEQGNPANN